jgi:hypothetical protein
MNTSRIPKDICELSRLKAVNFFQLSKNPIPRELEPGQIWSTHSSFQLPNGEQFQTDEPKLVIILLGSGEFSKKYESITVAPLSNHTSMASEYDFIVEEGERNKFSIPFNFMIEVWNETPALKGQLKNFICSLPSETMKALHQLYSSRLLSSEIPESLKKYVGMRIIVEDDPRLTFQEEEINTVSYLSKAATASLELDIAEEKNPVEMSNWLKLEIVPFLGKLSSFLKNPVVASAASSHDTEAERCLIMQLEKKENFIFELLCSRSRPYSIYLIIYSIAPTYIGRSCLISVKTKEQVYKSALTALDEDIVIEVGKDPHFQCENVESVELTIEPR